MRRPILLILFAQCLVIITLLEGFNLQLFDTGLTPYYDQVEKISGVVKTVQLKDSYSALNVDLGRENILVRLKGVTDEETVFDLVGRRIEAVGKITRPEGRRNPGLFNYEHYLAARNTHAIIETSRFKFTTGKIVRPLSHFLSTLKGLFLKTEKEMIDEKSFALLSGILFGEKGYLEDDVYEEYQTNGIAHVLAVSGLHVGLVYTAIRKLIKRNDYVASLISLALLFAYAALANFSVSVLRAGIMIGFHIASVHLHRRYDMLSAATATAIILLAVNPYYIYDQGAQLSFLAAYSLAVINSYFELRFKKYCDKRKSEKLFKYGRLLFPGISIQIGMVPLMIYHFLNFSPFSLFLNPVAISLASLILPLGLLSFLFFPFKFILAMPSLAVEILCSLLNKVSSLAGNYFHGFSVPAPSLGLLLLYYGLIFFFFSEARAVLVRKGKNIAVVGITLILAVSSSLLPFAFGYSMSLIPWKYNRYDLVFLDVGQGDSTHISSSGVNVLLDGGGSFYKDIAGDTLKPYLLKNGVPYLDLAIVSHLDSDHSKGIADLSKIYRIKKIAFPASAKDEDLSDFVTDEIIFLSEGDEIEIGDGKMKVISATGKDANEGSLVCEYKVAGTTALFMADVPIEKENKLSFFDVDILKVGHHGSKTSTGDYLLQSAKPEIAVISCGKNNRYGHPTDRVLALLQSFGIIIGRTDEMGAICIKNKNILTKY